jgi:hypothetical protein
MEEQERYVFDSLKTNVIENSEQLVLQKDYRTIFLKEFTKELIFNIDKINLKDNLTSKDIENISEVSERIRKKILEQIDREYEYKEMRNQKIEGLPQIPMNIQKPKPLPTIPIIRKGNINPRMKIRTREILKPIIPQGKKLYNTNIPPQIPIKKFNSPEEIINEIKKIFNDPKVIMIECAGRDKFLTIRTATRVMLTRIKLTEEEIKSVINKFSKETKIPIINGLLNAIKENLSMSAIISDIAGSRFLIKKFYLDS